MILRTSRASEAVAASPKINNVTQQMPIISEYDLVAPEPSVAPETSVAAQWTRPGAVAQSTLSYRAGVIRSLTELRREKQKWDELWCRSEVTIPTVRAEPLAQWVEQFAPRCQLHAVTVERDGELVAALPLVSGMVGRVVPLARQPVNEWTPAGELLVDESVLAEAMPYLVSELLRCVPYPLLRFDTTFSESSRWRAFIREVARRGVAFRLGDAFDVGIIPTTGDWQQCHRNWSKNHRKKMGQSLRRLEQLGNVQLCIRRPTDPQEAERLATEAFEIEHTGWKRDSGTSILSNDGILQWYLSQARELSRQGQLAFAFLEVNGEAIAFEYAWIAKQTWHSLKIGYDESYARYCPGHILLYKLLERFHSDRERTAVNLMSRITPALAHWRPNPHPTRSLTIGTNRVGRLLLNMRQLGRFKRAFRLSRH